MMIMVEDMVGDVRGDTVVTSMRGFTLVPIELMVGHHGRPIRKRKTPLFGTH